MRQTKREQILDTLHRVGVIRPRDVEAMGISGEYLNRLHAEGLLDRPSRGIYVLAAADPSEYRSLAEVCKRIPRGVVCLLSALRFHDLTTQAPFEIWMAIGEKDRAPRVETPAVRLVRFSEATLRYGAEEHTIEGVTARVFSPPKTIADCFKYRNKIGLDVALEALREGWKERKATMDQLWEAAKICRMSNVMRPYLETLT